MYMLFYILFAILHKNLVSILTTTNVAILFYAGSVTLSMTLKW